MRGTDSAGRGQGKVREKGEGDTRGRLEAETTKTQVVGRWEQGGWWWRGRWLLLVYWRRWY